jgi:hypothetical protein
MENSAMISAYNMLYENRFRYIVKAFEKSLKALKLQHEDSKFSSIV